MAATATHVNIGMPTRVRRLPLFKQKFEVQKHLKWLNKHAVKTIKSSDGDLIDYALILSFQPVWLAWLPLLCIPLFSIS